MILAVPAYVAASLLRGFDTTLAALVRGHPLRVDGHGRLRLSRAIRSPHPMQGSGFVVPRVERKPAAGRHLGHVEVAAAARPTATCCCAASSAAAAIRSGSMPTTTS